MNALIDRCNQLESRQRNHQCHNSERIAALEAKKDSMENEIETTVETKIDEQMDQLLENDEKFQEAAQRALTTLLYTESFTYRIGAKIVCNLEVYFKMNSIIQSFVLTSARQNPKLNF